MKRRRKIIIFTVIFLLLLVCIVYTSRSTSNNDVAPNSPTIAIDTSDDNTIETFTVTEDELAEINESLDETFSDMDTEIYFFDVGMADCALIRCNDEYALMDCGNTADGKLILDYLNKNNITKLKYLYLSHPHEDHIGGAALIVNNIEIETCLMPDRVVTTNIFEKLVDALLDKNVETISPKANDEFALGGGKLKILACDNENKELNSTSIVALFTYDEFDVLFTGDATTEIENQILSWYEFDDDIEVLKLAHHGSKTSNSMKYLEAVNPENIVISVGRGNSYGLPKAEIISRINKLDTELYRTDEGNTVYVTSDGSMYMMQYEDIILDGDGDGNNVTDDLQLVSCSKEEANFIASETGEKYHKLDCSYAKKISEEKAIYFATSEDAINGGFEKCKTCNP